MRFTAFLFAIVYSMLPQDSPRFEVASIRPNTSSSGKFDISVPPGRFTTENATLRQLILDAYGLQDFQLTGGQDWLTKDHFDIEAKVPAGVGDPLARGTNGAPSRMALMERALLADRFNLVVHTESKDSAIFVLVTDKKDGALGPQTKKTKHNCDAPGATEGPAPNSPMEPVPCSMSMFPGTLISGGVTLAELATRLAAPLGTLVVDQTGIAGRFDFTLRWTPDQIPPGFNRKAAAMGLAPIDENGPSLGTALREQLGIRLESQRAPVPILVIDRVEKPRVD